MLTNIIYDILKRSSLHRELEESLWNFFIEKNYDDSVLLLTGSMVKKIFTSVIYEFL